MDKATFAGGCFWAMEEAFAGLDGIESIRVGYTGGHAADPTHEAVRSGRTGHTEAVEIVFDPRVVSYQDLLETFFAAHDPTQLNRQGPDIGSEYRSAVFYHSAEQRACAERTRLILTKMKRYRNPIVTIVVPAGPFYAADESHQHFLAKERARNHPWTPPIAEALASQRSYRGK